MKFVGKIKSEKDTKTKKQSLSIAIQNEVKNLISIHGDQLVSIIEHLSTTSETWSEEQIFEE